MSLHNQGLTATAPEGQTRILLLRHGETASPDRFHGAESDVGLSERGVEQAGAIGRYLAGLQPAAVFCSGMRRARDTAGPIAEACGVSVEVLEALHERRMGSLSGRAKAEGWDVYASEAAHWMAGELDYCHDADAESFAEVRDRVVPVLRDLAGRWRGRTVVVVAHGIVIRIALATLPGDLTPADFHKIGIDNTALNDLRWDGDRWHVAAQNHLPHRPA